MLHSNLSRAEMALMIAEFKVAVYKLMTDCPACGQALRYDVSQKATLFCCAESRKGILHLLKLAEAKGAHIETDTLPVMEGEA